MDVVILFYNIVYTGIITIAIASAYYLRKRSKRSIYFYVEVMFFIYLVANTVIFCTELVDNFASIYNKIFISTASFRTIYYICLMGCMMFVYYNVMLPESPLPCYFAAGAYVTVLICVPLIPIPTWRIFFYFLPTQMIISGLGIAGLIRMKRKPEKYKDPYFKRVKQMLVLMLIFGILIVIEDSIVIFHFDVYNYDVRITHRSFTENMFFLSLAVVLIKITSNDIVNLEKTLDKIEDFEVCSEQQIIRIFSQEYNLTIRERDILEQILVGKSQQEISDNLMIALGTVKTHIHNIYQKTDVTKRSQLMFKYQTYCKEHYAESAIKDQSYQHS